MANLDTTRHLLDAGKHYVGARMQQGRSLLDSDWNEDAGLRADDLRQTLVELLGAHGSTNAGFSVGAVDTFVSVSTGSGGPVVSYDFELRPGSLWVGGMRLTVEGKESFLSQADWLQINRDAANLPSQPTAQQLLGPPNMGDYYFYEQGLVASKRHDLVYVEVWEQAITAVEDAELRERGLGGPDSSVRVRRMRRVHVLPNLGSDGLGDALAQLQATLVNGVAGGQSVSLGTIDPDTYELRSAAELTVTPITELGEQPCGPTPPRGYTGHEDQAIRVELRGPTSLVWGFGDAAPLYRARIGSGRVVKLLGRPRDPRRYPQAGQIAELIGWGSKLPNDEKAADMLGDLVRIGAAYDPSTGELELAEDPPQDLLTWLDDATDDHSEPDEDASYVYVRIWDRGPDITSDVLLDASEGVIDLGHTGLQLRLTGAGHSGDYWIIAARRASPEAVVPWQLLESESPHGPRRFYAPLAILTWEAPLQLLTEDERNELEDGTFFVIPYDVEVSVAAVYGPVVARVRDLRRPLAPLCIRGCTTITVGDADKSYGMVDTLQEALDLLPAAGGHIRLLRGDHSVNAVVLTGLSNVRISGCGLESKLVPTNLPTPAASIYTQGSPLLVLRDCSNIVLEDFVLVGDRTVGVRLEDVADTNRDVTLRRLRFEMDGVHNPPPVQTYALSQAAILALGSDGLTIEGCHVQYSATLNYTPAFVLGGSRMIVRDNTILAGFIGVTGSVESMGGVQILSYSQDVELSRNLIRGGWGHGVALGHVLDVNDLSLPMHDPPLDAATSWAGMRRMLGDALSNLHNYAPNDDESPTSGLAEEWTPGGPLIDVRVRDNRIFDKGLSGISTGGFLDSTKLVPRFIVVVNLDIHRNEVIGNMQITGLDTSRFINCDSAVGGVCVAAAINLQIRENVIRNNGADFETPIVGVGVVTAQGVVVQDNVIVDNGLEHDTPDSSLPDVGLRGGIAVCEVSAVRDYVFPDAVADITVSVPSFTLRSNSIALSLRKNEVSQRIGKALWVVRGFGPIAVTENSLRGLGDPVDSIVIEHSFLAYNDDGDLGPDLSYPAQGACVEIRNYATSPILDYSGATIQTMVLGDPATPTFEGGAIEFSGNEVSLDWHWLDGYAASVVLSSLDSVKVTDNVMLAVMGNDHSFVSSLPEDAAFLDDLINQGTASDSFLMVNCWAGAPATVQASGNRFEEGQFDCLFSYLGAHAAAFGSGSPDNLLTELTMGSVFTMNVGTHCLIGPKTIPAGSPTPPGPLAPPDNLVVYEVVVDCARSADVGNDTVDQTVSIVP